MYNDIAIVTEILIQSISTALNFLYTAYSSLPHP
jgi:hypothetical protein